MTLRKSCKFLGIAVILGVLLLGLSFYILSLNLPTIDSLKDYKPSPGTVVYAEDGRVLGRIHIEKGLFVPFKRIPKFLISALLATEDPRFYTHTGVDYRGIMRAALKNIMAVRVAQGGSTITQQLAKVVFLSPERKIKRKIKEIILARRLEQELTKDEILELYLNRIYFGHSAYGVQMAARTYFGKNIWEVNHAEAALLAGLPKSPRAYSPYNDIDLAKLRQAHVLKRMVDEKYISEAESRTIFGQPINLENLRTQEELAPHLVDYIRRYITKKYGLDQLYYGGLKVYTTIDLDLQRAAVNALKEGLRALDKRQGFRGRIGYKKLDDESFKPEPLRVMVKPDETFNALVLAADDEHLTVKGRGLVGFIVKEDLDWALKQGKRRQDGSVLYKKPSEIVEPGDIIKVRLKEYDPQTQVARFALEQTPLVEGAVVSIEPFTGFVKAMVGGYDFVEGGFNHATEARRQPGSAFKPFVYGAALENGFTTASIVMDLPVIRDESEENKRGWRPENYDERFLGPMRLRKALALSRNAVTVHLLDKIGLNKAVAFARRSGITSPINNDLTAALGSSSVTPIELTSAYATFASQGYRTAPLMITGIADGNGEVLESREPEPKEAIDPDTAYLVTSLLKSVVEEGTGRGARVLEKPLAGKTGTTNNYIDAWFVGFAPSIVTGVWVGYDNARASLGNRETGARAALPIWINVMAQALVDQPADDFLPPDDVVFLKIDRESGLLAWDDDPDSIIDVFRSGTEPTQYADASKKERPDFFSLDQGMPAEESQITNTQAEEEIDE